MYLYKLTGSPQIGGSSQNGGDTIGGSSQTGGQVFGGAETPDYLSIPGFEDCLKKYTPSDASHSQFCLPNKKPNSCNENSWEALNGENGFQGDCPIKCYVSPSGMPAISKHGLQKFYDNIASQKTCDEGVKQCQLITGRFSALNF